MATWYGTKGADEMLSPGDGLQGRYEIRAVVGRGGMGVVYRATHSLLATDVAIKETLVQDPARRSAVLAQSRWQTPST